MWRVRLFRLLSWVIGALPQRLVYRLASLVALILSLVPSRRRTALRENIAIAHGLPTASPRVRRDARRAFWHALLNYIDLLRLDRPDALERIMRIPIPDLAPLDEALAVGKGLILISAHLGNTDTVIQTLAVRGYRVLIPSEEIRPPELLAYLQAQRQVLGVRIEPIGPETMRLMTAHLRAGGIVVVVSDRDVQGTGIAVPFFGRTVALPAAAILLALRTGAPVLGGFGFRHSDGSISGRLTARLVFSKDREAGPRSIRAGMAAGMHELVAVLEQEIRRDPGQWTVQQPIFSKPRPSLVVRLRRHLAPRDTYDDRSTSPAAAHRSLSETPLAQGVGRP